MEEMTTKDLQVAAFPEALHRAVKATAAMHGMSAKEAYIQAAQAWVYANRDESLDLSALDP